MPASHLIKRFLPRSLLGRSLLIVVTPLVILQLVSGIIFWETHWDNVSLRLSRSVAGDISAVIELMDRFPGPENRDWIFDLAAGRLGLSAGLREKAVLPSHVAFDGSYTATMLGHALDDQIRQTYLIDEETYPDHVIVDVQLAEGVLHMVMQRKRLFSSTVYVFVLWMIGTAMILVGIASIFMRNQVKPIRRLAVAADNFGKGRDVVRFKPEGAKEVRQAASAFMAMRERIMRQISQRTEMLAGVSHDLRTPLTRMKLQLAMAGDAEGVQDLKSDVEEMEHMLESYLAFARGEGAEAPEPTDLTALLNEVVAQARRSGAPLDIHAEGDFTLPLRPKAVKRALTNLVDNAVRYAGHVAVRLGRREGRHRGDGRRRRPRYSGGKARGRVQGVLSARCVAQPGHRRYRAGVDHRARHRARPWRRRGVGGFAPGRPAGPRLVPALVFCRKVPRCSLS